MLDELLRIIAPHYCCGCHRAGTVLCASCIYNIVDDAPQSCVVCGQVTSRGICPGHSQYIDSGWVVSMREGSVRQLIDGYKFEQVRAAYKPLAQLLLETSPALPAGTVVTAIPTISSHIRQRGYDHAALIAKRLAKIERLPYRKLLARQHNHRQRGASRSQRFEQAKEAFVAARTDMPQSVLLIDDIVTTGATVLHAARRLKEAGVEHVMVGVVAKQPLDQTGEI